MKSIRTYPMSLLLLLSLFIISCNSNKLSREEAEKIIKSQFQEIEKKEFEICTHGYEYSSNAGEQNSLMANLHNLGMIKMTERKNWYDIPGIDKIEITEKASKYIISKRIDYNTYITCKLSDNKFGEITGISQQEDSNTALVKYTIIKTVTPFGEALNMKNGASEVSVTFTKYDDGWRIGK